VTELSFFIIQKQLPENSIDRDVLFTTETVRAMAGKGDSTARVPRMNLILKNSLKNEAPPTLGKTSQAHSAFSFEPRSLL